MTTSKQSQAAAQKRSKAVRHRRIVNAAMKLGRTEHAQILEGLPDPMLTRLQVLAQLGVGHTLFEKMVADGRMPKPIPYSSRTHRWKYSEVMAAIEKLRARPAPGAPSLSLVN